MAFRLRARARIERPMESTGMPRASKARVAGLRGDLGDGSAAPPAPATATALPGVTGVKPSASLSGVAGLRRRDGSAVLLGRRVAAVPAVAVVVLSARSTGIAASADGPRRCIMGM